MYLSYLFGHSFSFAGLLFLLSILAVVDMCCFDVSPNFFSEFPLQNYFFPHFIPCTTWFTTFFFKSSILLTIYSTELFPIFSHKTLLLELFCSYQHCLLSKNCCNSPLPGFFSLLFSRIGVSFPEFQVFLLVFTFILLEHMVK